MTILLDSPTLSAAVAEVWERASYEHARNWQTEPGISSVFGCQRQVGYQFAGTEPTDPLPAPDSRINRQAMLGTWIHEKFLPHLAEALGAELVEVEVFADHVRGHLDLAGIRYVIDLKTCSTAKLSRVRRQGPSRNNRAQVMMYARARIDVGMPVDRVGLVYLDRENGDTYCWTSEYDPGLVEDALIWFHEARYGNPEFLPRGGKGPGLDFKCDECPFLSLCWPNGHKTVLDEADDRDEALVSALEVYADASAREATAKADKQFAGALLAGEQKGQYGDQWHLGWRSTGRRLDQKAAKQILLELGIEPPLLEASYYPVVSMVEADDEGQE